MFSNTLILPDRGRRRSGVLPHLELRKESREREQPDQHNTPFTLYRFLLFLHPEHRKGARQVFVIARPTLTPFYLGN